MITCEKAPFAHVRRKHCLLAKCDIDQQLLARDVHNIAERALTLTREVQRHAAVPDAQVTNVQKVEPIRQSWIHDMKFLASS